jgi:hypothetical protein
MAPPLAVARVGVEDDDALLAAGRQQPVYQVDQPVYKVIYYYVSIPSAQSLKRWPLKYRSSASESLCCVNIYCSCAQNCS